MGTLLIMLCGMIIGYIIAICSLAWEDLKQADEVADEVLSNKDRWRVKRSKWMELLIAIESILSPLFLGLRILLAAGAATFVAAIIGAAYNFIN